MGQGTLVIVLSLTLLVAACGTGTDAASGDVAIDGCRVCRCDCPAGIDLGAFYRLEPLERCDSPFPTTERPFKAQQFCSQAGPGRIRVVFRWLPSLHGGARAQWLDLSLADNGFAAGSFVSHGPLAPWEADLELDGLAAAKPHFWRVNTLIDGGWQRSEGQALPAGAC